MMGAPPPLEKITEVPAITETETDVVGLESVSSSSNVTGSLLFEVGATLSEMQQQHYVQMELSPVEDKVFSSKMSS